MLTVTIPYRGNPTNLAVLLAQLQPQLSDSDDIYIVDGSPNREALKIARMYGTTRCYIFVEIGQITNAFIYGLQSMKENKQDAVLFIDSNCFISATLVANMKKALSEKYGIIQPVIIRNSYDKMDPNFKLYNSSVPEITFFPVKKENSYCFLYSRGIEVKSEVLLNEKVLINEKFKL